MMTAISQAGVTVETDGHDTLLCGGCRMLPSELAPFRTEWLCRGFALWRSIERRMVPQAPPVAWAFPRKRPVRSGCLQRIFPASRALATDHAGESAVVGLAAPDGPMALFRGDVPRLLLVPSAARA